MAWRSGPRLGCSARRWRCRDGRITASYRPHAPQRCGSRRGHGGGRNAGQSWKPSRSQGSSAKWIRAATPTWMRASSEPAWQQSRRFSVAWAALSAKVPRPLVVAGYSVGELAAWGVAGLLDYQGVLDLAVQRAAAMDEATIQPSGLVAIHGLKRDTLEEPKSPSSTLKTRWWSEARARPSLPSSMTLKATAPRERRCCLLRYQRIRRCWPLRATGSGKR